MDNTGNYETKNGAPLAYTKEVEVVGISGNPVTEDYVDEKGTFSAIAPADAPAVLTWSNLSVATKPARGREPKQIINNINGCISGGLWGIMGASGTYQSTTFKTRCKHALFYSTLITDANYASL